ncbi:MAG TPA: sugar ABC transporter permease, partial [Spirochaetia bacterium]|nr:sugar ABC transporter permease [Spirochaetia bacterium]
WQTTGFMTLFILAGLQSLPRDVFEAANIDGANAWLRLVRIKLPLVWPVLASAVVLRAMDAFRIFDIAYVLTDGGPLYSTETVSLFTYRVGLAQFNMALASASSLLVLVAVILISMPLMRNLMEDAS